MMRSALGAVGRLVYPGLCLVCGTETPEVFCGTCLGGFREISGPCCTGCGRPFDSASGPDRRCADCIRKPPVYRSAYAPLRYEGPVVDAVHLFKYRGLRGAAAVFEGGIRSAVRRRFAGLDAVVPVPLHRRRLALRGFNQSLTLAGMAADASGTELIPDGLVRTRYTRPQVELRHRERIGNVKGAFAVRDPSVFEGRSVLLVDDVYTTGATASECARVLVRAGASSVHVLTAARTV